MKYKPQRDGDLIFPNMDRYKLRCCDCGLIHDIYFAVYEVSRTRKNGTFSAKPLRAKKYQVAFKPYRNNRATAATRRKK